VRDGIFVMVVGKLNCSKLVNSNMPDPIAAILDGKTQPPILAWLNIPYAIIFVTESGKEIVYGQLEE